MEETLHDYRERVTADVDTNYRPRTDWRTVWPTIPAAQGTTETNGDYRIRVTDWMDDTWRPWYDGRVPPPADDPQYSGNNGGPPPPPPLPRKKN